MNSYKGSSYYKRKRKKIVIITLCVVLLLLACFAFYFFTECIVFTSDSWRIELPWKDYSQLEPKSDPDDGSSPIIEINTQSDQAQ
ncbi:MAG: hypothetical protein IJE90_02925 [Clostridia bacterium]|nr:hypothetical protein [Clostridia bacterium]